MYRTGGSANFTELQILHTFTAAAASLICSIVKTPKISSSVTAFITASATSSTLTGGARSKSEAGREFKGLVKFSITFRNFSTGSPIKSRGISNPSTFRFPYMNPGLRTTPVQVQSLIYQCRMAKITCIVERGNDKGCCQVPDDGYFARTSDSAFLFPVK